MNKTRRKQIEKTIEKIVNSISELETIKDDEQDVYDNIPENLQATDRAMESEDAINTLEEAIDNLSEIVESLNGLTY